MTMTPAPTTQPTCGDCIFTGSSCQTTQTNLITGRCFAGFCLVSNPQFPFTPFKCSSFLDMTNININDRCVNIFAKNSCQCTKDIGSVDGKFSFKIF